MNLPKMTKLACLALFVAITTTTLASACQASTKEDKATKESSGPTTNLVEEEKGVKVPELADVVPLASDLAGRLLDLENKASGLIDISFVEKRYAVIETDLKDLADRVKRFQESKNYRYQNLVDLRGKIKAQDKEFDGISKPLHRTIRQLGQWRDEWHTEKEQWEIWQSNLITDDKLNQLKSTFKQAYVTIDSALSIVNTQLGTMLTLQKKAGKLNGTIDSLIVELNNMIRDIQRNTSFNASPPMHSFKYFSQFDSGLWPAVQRGLTEISLPGSRFFARQGWVIIVQISLFLLVVIGVYRNLRLVRESDRWQFLAERPFSAGLFLACMASLFIFAYEGAPTILLLANYIVAAIAFARLAGGLLEESWQRQLVPGAMIALIVTHLMYFCNIPLPLTRLFIFSTALIGFFFCMHCIKKSLLTEKPGVYPWLLALIALFLAIIAVDELRGRDALSSYLFEALIDSIATVAVFMLMMYIIHGCLEWLFRGKDLQQVTDEKSNQDENIIHRISGFLDLIVCVFILIPALMMIWRVYDNLQDAIKGLLTFGFSVGSNRYSFSLLILSIGLIYLSFLLSWIFQKLLMDEVIFSRPLEKGVRLSMARLAHYFIIVVGFLIALATIGFEITQLTIMISALSVGIGFGLQGMVNNFVSGLILLFERPVRVGDVIELGGSWAEIKSIGLRATTIQTYDQADLIIPNADLVTNQVTNWTLSSRRVRLILPVGVAYGSDVPLVMEKLLESANEIPLVASTPAPQVLFMAFGENSLNFQLRVWVLDADHRIETQSELHQEIDDKFREAGIEISFPQRDLHIRSVDESVILKPNTSAGNDDGSS